MLGHPVGQIIGYFYAMDMGIYRTVETNVKEVPVQFLAFMCILFGLVRLLGFWIFTRRYQRLPAIIRGFALANLPALFGSLTFYLLTQELEGNIVGFIVAPLMIGAVFILVPWIFFNSFLQIKQLRSLQEPPEKIQPTSNDWSPGKVTPGKGFLFAIFQSIKGLFVMIFIMFVLIAIGNFLT